MLSVVCVLAWLIDWWLTVFFVLYRCCRFVRVMKSVSGNGVICIAWVCSCPRKIFLKWTSFLVIPHFWICGNNGFGYNVGIIWETPNWSLRWGVMWLRIRMDFCNKCRSMEDSPVVNSRVVTVTVSCCIDSTLAKICCFSGMLYSHFFDECDWVLVTRRQEAFGLNVFKPNCGRWVKAHV